MDGMVTRVFLTRGFSFIRGVDNLDYFGHVDEMCLKEDWEKMRAGEHVTFEPSTGGNQGNGLRALNIILIGGNSGDTA